MSRDFAGTAAAPLWRETPSAWVALAGAALALVVAFAHGLGDLVDVWDTQDEYSHGYVIPFVAAFLVWQRRDVLQRTPFAGAWSGFALVALALVLLVAGELATLGTVVQYAFVLAVFGLALAYAGWPGMRVLAGPLLILALMVPLPNYLLRELSAALQLVSSQLGVAFIRLFGISVHLEGNVIDLGAMKLQVVEACSGLRYLFPLMTLGVIAACFFRGAFWKRAFIVLSTLPITVFMNSLRIGLIGVTVEYWGRGMAEGLLHDFEGWFVFMLCTALLVAEMALLARIGPDRTSLREAFVLDLPAAQPQAGDAAPRALPRPFVAAGLLVASAALLMQFMPEHSAVRPERREFIDFPMTIGSWGGRPERIAPVYLDNLKLDDYLLADYARPGAPRPVNLYVSYYAEQTRGNSAHSPRACIPGDGWQMGPLQQHVLQEVAFGGAPLRVNRTVIAKGDNRQLVYYWFQQRGRNVTDEYVVKLWIMWDALTRRRTDGAMVRLVAPIAPGEDERAAEARLVEFAREAVPRLARYVPE